MKRPEISFENSNTDLLLEGLAWLGFAAIWGITFLYQGKLPDPIPIHFDLSGQPDDWAGKWSFWLLPGIGSILFLLLSWVKTIPHRYNYAVNITPENARRQYALGRGLILWLRVELVALFAYIQLGIAKTAMGEWTGLGNVFLFVIGGLLLLSLIVYFYLSRRNA